MFKIKGSKILILSVIGILLFFIINHDRNKNETFVRIQVPIHLNQKLDTESFTDYFYSFTTTLFSEYKVEKDLSPAESQECFKDETCIEFSGSLKDDNTSQFAFLSIPDPGRMNMSLLIWNTSNIYQSRDASDHDSEIRNSTIMSTCGPQSDGIECKTYVDQDGDLCYLMAVNGKFVIHFDELYCPTKRVFSSQKAQYVNYIVDAFLSLDIPYEFSFEYRNQVN